MITLSRSLADDLARGMLLHTRLCPRQVIGARMARWACSYLEIDPALDRKQVYVFMECGRCAADAVIAVTGASPTNRLMQLMDYGKVAATFVNLRTGEAIRVWENPASRDAAVALMPDRSAWEAQRDGYQVLPDESLLQWTPVRLNCPLPLLPEKHAATCSACGARIHDYREIVVRGAIFCHACAYGGYYSAV